MIIPNLKARQRTGEILDDPALPSEEVIKALAGLARLNKVSRAASVLWSEIKTLARQRQFAQLRILDVASGGGEVLLALTQKAERSGLQLQVAACDINPFAMRHAQTRFNKAEAKVNFFKRDVLHEALPGGYDVVMCSLFLHHLQREDAVRLLQQMARAAGALILINDLERTLWNYYLVLLGSRLLSRSHVVHFDALRSVESAFTLREVSEIAQAAGFTNFKLKACWPGRYLLSWHKP